MGNNFETTFNGILQILNDPVINSMKSEPFFSIRYTTKEQESDDRVGYEMVITVMPNNEQYTINDFWEKGNYKTSVYKERFYQKCVMFLLFHWKNDKKERIWEN